MQKTSFTQKIALLIFGIVLTLVIIEISLRLAGFFVYSLQEKHNHASFKSREYRILCLGESTTALGGEDAYPSQLEYMLNVQNKQQVFSVINEGIVSTTSAYILSHLDQNLDKYKPQLIIVMMGINDKAYLHVLHKNSWWENMKAGIKDFRVYKLFHLLYERFRHQGKEQIKVPDNTPDSSYDTSQRAEKFLEYLITGSLERFHYHLAHHEGAMAKQSLLQVNSTCIELARRYRLRGALQEAEDVLKQTTPLNPNYCSLFDEWGQIYLAEGKNLEAVEAFETSLKSDPQDSDALLGLAHAYHQAGRTEAFFVYDQYLNLKPNDYWGHIELAQWLRENKHDDMAEEYLARAIQKAPYFDQGYIDLGQTLDDQHQYQNEENFYLKAISRHPKNVRLDQALGEFYHRQGKEDLAHQYFQKAAEVAMAEYHPATLVNYDLLLKKIVDRRIKVIVMQYPVRSIAPLEDYLGQRNGVTFVENKENFKQAMSKQGYWYYFKDNFAYDFGHCTRAGNKLIAEHLTDVILNKIINAQN